jgi:hypothetical protein
VELPADLDTLKSEKLSPEEQTMAHGKSMMMPHASQATLDLLPQTDGLTLASVALIRQPSEVVV